MPHTDAPRIYYETSGDARGTPLVLIEGLGAQLLGWRAGFVDKLVARGLHVIRIDNRDVGLSDKFGEPGDYAAAYAIDDMADDVVRVLDAIGIGAAHVVGQSMGGAIAQRLALRSPERVRSATLFYTAPAFGVEFVTEEALARAAAPPPAADLSRAEAVEAHVASERYAASRDYPFDEAWIRECGGLCYDRGFRPDGVLRQVAALLGAGDWREELAALTLPVAIIHGRADRLIKVEAGFELARRIPTPSSTPFRAWGTRSSPSCGTCSSTSSRARSPETLPHGRSAATQTLDEQVEIEIGHVRRPQRRRRIEPARHAIERPEQRARGDRGIAVADRAVALPLGDHRAH